ncbi:hypothetical protein A7K99_04315 [Tatumella citrea]|uniref:Glycosyltransferase 2-like domain-containing protein n=2 Tax=Tatumella citrea TaxID=53336 RepID=A0A1Y0LQQ6_TATCI|nr:hypothetical protein A7K98_04315 [Tatumella citrea]ARV00071.1 hypothetical protein A7K99_04315 [Tatumella citrea]
MPILMECNDNDILVYADDDVIYGREWLSELYSHFCEFSGEYVVASRIRKMRRNIFGHLRSYNDFPLVADSEILYKDFIITGVGGCMLSRKHILSKFVFTDDYLSLAPKADDIWLSISMQLSGAKVLPCLKAYSQVQQIEHDNFALSSFNTLFKRNTKWNALISKVRNKVLGYLGYSLTMNDKTLKLVISSLKNK